MMKKWYMKYGVWIVIALWAILTGLVSLWAATVWGTNPPILFLIPYGLITNSGWMLAAGIATVNEEKNSAIKFFMLLIFFAVVYLVVAVSGMYMIPGIR